MKVRIFILISFCFLQLVVVAQKGQTTLGLQLKPMFASKFFETGPQRFISDSLDATLFQKLGWNTGVVIRKGINDMWSIESGISMVQRNFELKFYSQRYQIEDVLKYKMVGYEIPVQALIYVQLSPKWYINGSGGVALDFYPSNLYKTGSVLKDTLYVDAYAKTFRTRWAMLAATANLGFEYRTKDYGYFYFGASYHRPMGDIALTQLRVESKGAGNDLWMPIGGTYLTLDLRYFLKPDQGLPKQKKRP
jgi:hypothetical protein